MEIDVLEPGENFRGMSYGNYAAIWSNWLFSEDPDTYNGGTTLFLRGNVDYRPINNVEGAPRFIDPNGIYDRTGSKGQEIFENTSIFVPIITSLVTIGHRFEGRILKSEEDIRDVLNLDTDESGDMWATIMRKGDSKSSKIVNDLKKYRIESPLFKLTIPENSLLKDRSEEPFESGTYDAIAGGYFLLIRSLPPSTYRILFGGKGRGIYFTNSAYDITVRYQKRDTVVDISNKMIDFEYPQHIQPITDDHF